MDCMLNIALASCPKREWAMLVYRVFTVSMGMVVYTVMIPASPPRPKVLAAPSFSPGAT